MAIRDTPSSKQSKMAAPTKHMGRQQIEFALKSGASLVKAKPLFSYDNKYLLVCTGWIVKVYSTLSGECVKELRGHQSYVTGLVTHPRNKLRVVSCSLDQTVRVWDYNDGVMFQSILLTTPLHGIYTSSGSNVVFLIKQSAHGYDLERCPLKQNTDVKPLICLRHIQQDPRRTAISHNGHFSVTVDADRMKWAENKKDGKTIKHITESGQTLTCVVCHPNGKCIATGCGDGKIMMWYNFDSINKVVRTTIHWHSLEVRDLCYTPEGSYLLSGGYECVLVKMHEESKYKDFLPRLGAHISHLVCSQDNMKYAICLVDNSIQVVSSSLSLEQVFQGLTRNYLEDPTNNPIPTGLVLDPRTHALMTNGKPGHLQFYSVHEDRQLYNLDIVGQNFISPDHLDNTLAVTTITSAAFDSTGLWLGTAEYWNDGQNTPDVRLKFWRYQPDTHSYSLNTVVESPHDEKIDRMKMRPLKTVGDPDSGNMAVTSSRDGKFRMWTVEDDTDIYRTNVKWTCQSVGYYRQMAAGDLVFTEDGSLLAVVFESVITLWEPDNNQLKGTLIKHLHHSPVLHVEFGRESSCQYLVSCTQNEITVWDMLSLSVHWSVSIKVQCVTPDPRSNLMAAFTSQNNLFVFNPAVPAPVAVYNCVSESTVLSAVFIPHSHKNQYQGTSLSWQSQSELFFMNTRQELLTVSFKSETVDTPLPEEAVELTQDLPHSALSLLMQGHTGRHVSRLAQDKLKVQPQGKYLKELFQSASHVQPSVQVMCRPFIRSLLVSAVSQRKISDQDEEEEDDEGVEAESEEESRELDSQTGSMDSGVSDMDVDSVSQSQSSSKSAESPNTRNKHRCCKMSTVSDNLFGELTDEEEKLLKMKLDWYVPTATGASSTDQC